MELYASGGASFACAATQIISTTKVGRANITSSSGYLATFGCEVSIIGTSGRRLEPYFFIYEYEVRVQQYLSTKYLLKDTGGWKIVAGSFS